MNDLKENEGEDTKEQEEIEKIMRISEKNKRKESELSSVLDELGCDSSDDILMKVYRVDELTNKEDWCFDCRPDALPLEPRLLDAYGGGHFTILVMTPTPQGRKSLFRKAHIRIVKIKKETQGEKQNFEAVMTGMIKAMQESQSAMMNAFRESQLEAQIKTQELLLNIMAEKTGQNNTPTLIEQLTLLKNLMPEPPDAMAMLNSMMDMHSKVKNEFVDEPAPEGSLASMTNALGSLVDLAKNAPAPQKKSDEKISTNKESVPVNILIQHRLVSHIRLLISKAIANKNPALWAELTVDEIPEQYHAQLLDFVGKDNEAGMANLIKLEPEAGKQKAWFLSLLSEIRDIFLNPNEESLTHTENADENTNHVDLTSPGNPSSDSN